MILHNLSSHIGFEVRKCEYVTRIHTAGKQNYKENVFCGFQRGKKPTWLHFHCDAALRVLRHWLLWNFEFPFLIAKMLGAVDFEYRKHTKFQFNWSIAVEETEACTPVTQRAWVRSPVGTSFLGEGFSGFLVFSIYLLSNLVELRPCGLLFHSTRL